MIERHIVRRTKSQDTEEGRRFRVVTEEADSATRCLMVFPEDVFEWRVAEYGFDPEDIDTILDVVLHERFIPDPLDPHNWGQDAAMEAGLVAPANRPWGRLVQIGNTVPVTLFNARSKDEAREAHLARVEKVKRERALVIPPQVSLERGVTTPPNPLDFIRAEVRVDRNRIEQFSHHVHQIREMMNKRVADRVGQTRVIRPLPPSKLKKPQDPANNLRSIVD